MENKRIDVIATTISGSVGDWGKVKRIVPLFNKYGRHDVTLFEVDSHSEARKKTCDLVSEDGRTIISAGGSGTFNSVLEGCIDSNIDLSEITLGFLRKGSADLIGKTIGMPDDIEDAIKIFVDSLANHSTTKCDVIRIVSGDKHVPYRHFVGYGGAEIFGRIPHYTENRFTKYYKGILGQIFGDLGPFYVGASLSSLERVMKSIGHKSQVWTISVDGVERACGRYQAMIIVNGDLGPDLPFAKSAPLGSGNFYLFAIQDIGLHNLLTQFRKAFNGSILEQPERWGFKAYRIDKILKIEPDTDKAFPINRDGSTMMCEHYAEFTIVDQINLLTNPRVEI